MEVKMCVKACEFGVRTCGTVSHETKAWCPPVDDKEAVWMIYVPTTQQARSDFYIEEWMVPSEARSWAHEGVVKGVDVWLDHFGEWKRAAAIAEEEKGRKPPASGKAITGLPTEAEVSVLEQVWSSTEEEENNGVGMECLKDLVVKLAGGASSLDALMMSALARVTARLERGETSMGTRPDRFSPSSVWEVMMVVKTEADALGVSTRKELSELSRKAERNTLDKVRELESRMRAWMARQPVASGEAGMTPEEKARQEALFNQVLALMEKQELELEALKQGGVGSLEGSTMSVELRSLKDQVMKLESKTGGGVTLDQFHFDSKRVADEFLVKHGLLPNLHLILDVVSLMNSADRMAFSTQEEVRQVAAARKGGFNDLSEAAVLASFGFRLPSLFLGNAKSDDVFKDHKLPALKSMEYWDDDTSQSKRRRVEEQVSMRVSSLRNEMSNSSMTDEGKRLCKWMLEESHHFTKDLFQQMARIYGEMRREGGASDKEAWSLTGRVVDCVFGDIAGVRNPAADAGKSESVRRPGDAERLFWASLQAHVVMESYRKANFMGHPSVGPVMTKYIMSNRVALSEFEKLQTVVNAVKKTADQAQSTANDVKKKQK